MSNHPLEPGIVLDFNDRSGPEYLRLSAPRSWQHAALTTAATTASPQAPSCTRLHRER
jgi:hypothetical protein